ncbi:MAG: VOC family protein [Halobacteriales archaeon]|nr:VOC family protein [Halobacteriales archaeon]
MTTPSHSQKPTTLPAETRIGRTALLVNDLDELTAFYRDVVGLTVVNRTETAAHLGAEEAELLVLAEEEQTLTRHRSAAGLYHNAFRVPTRAALGDALARVREHWQLGGASSHAVSEALYLTDPEGNGIEIYRDHPRDEWPMTSDGTVKIGTYPLDLGPIEAAATGESSVPAGTDVGHIHLEVTSLADFRDFYVDTLGFEVQTELPAATFVSAGGYHHHLGANTWHHRTKPIQGRGLQWFELIVPNSAALDSLRARLTVSEYDVIDDEGFSVTDADGVDVRLRSED